MPSSDHNTAGAEKGAKFGSNISGFVKDGFHAAENLRQGVNSAADNAIQPSAARDHERGVNDRHRTHDHHGLSGFGSGHSTTTGQATGNTTGSKVPGTTTTGTTTTGGTTSSSSHATGSAAPPPPSSGTGFSDRTTGPVDNTASVGTHEKTSPGHAVPPHNTAPADYSTGTRSNNTASSHGGISNDAKVLGQGMKDAWNNASHHDGASHNTTHSTGTTHNP